MSEENKPLFEMDLGEHGNRLVFNSPQDLRSWNDRELNQWNWLRGAGGTAIEPVWGQHQTFHNRVATVAEDWNRNIGNAREVQNILEQLRRAIDQFYPSHWILNSTSPAARFVFDLRNKRSESAAAGAYAGLSSSPVRLGGDARPEFIDGLIEAFLFKREVDWTATAHQQALNDLKKQYEEEGINQAGRGQEIERHNHSLNIAFEQTLKEKQDGLVALYNNQANEFDNLRREHVAKLKAIEDTYDAKLALQKPVEYWDQRKTYHTERSNIFGVVALVVGVGDMTKGCGWRGGEMCILRPNILLGSLRFHCR